MWRPMCFIAITFVLVFCNFITAVEAESTCIAAFKQSDKKVSDFIVALGCLENTTSLPKGVILAWYATTGSVPDGWAVCDGTNGTPDLRGRFLRGVGNLADVKAEGGGNPKIEFTIAPDPRHVSDWRWGDTPWGTTEPRHAAKAYQTFSFDNQPPFANVIFIMKLK